MTYVQFLAEVKAAVTEMQLTGALVRFDTDAPPELSLTVAGSPAVLRSCALLVERLEGDGRVLTVAQGVAPRELFWVFARPPFGFRRGGR
jgi:hypothetical protein